MAEQILHGSNVVTAAEQGRRERVAEGVRCGGLRDACLFYGTFEGALKGLVIHVMATHDTAPWIGRMRVLRKNPEPRPGMPGARILPLKGTVAKLAMRQPFVLFKGLTFQKLCLPGAFRPGDHHNKMLRPGLCVVHASPQYL